MDDVLIIGAGPAGSAAVSILVKACANIRWLERQAFPRPKPCAGILPPRAAGIMGSLGFEQELVRPSSRYFRGYRVYAPSGFSYQKDYPEPGWVVGRKWFDQALAEHTGVPIIHDRCRTVTLHADHVEVSGDRERYRSRFMIAADGARSTVRQQIGLPALTRVLAVQYRIAMPETMIDDLVSDYIELHYTLPFGYYWVVPLDTELVIGALAVTSDWNRLARRTVDRFIEHWYHSHSLPLPPPVRTRFEAGMIPIHGPLPPLAKDRIVLAGDAGGFTDSNNGEGIVYALASGNIAAQAVIDILSNENEKSSNTAALELPHCYEQKIEAAGLLELLDRNKLLHNFSTTDSCEAYVRTRYQHWLASKQTVKKSEQNRPES